MLRHGFLCTLTALCGTSFGAAPALVGFLAVLLQYLRIAIAVGVLALVMVALAAIIDRVLREIDRLVEEQPIARPPAPSAETESGGGGSKPPPVPPLLGGSDEEDSDANDLTPSERSTLADALRPDKLGHIFDPKHKFDSLISQFGSREAVMEEIVRSLRGGLPGQGVFEVTRVIGGQTVVIRGAVVDGVARIGTAFIP